MKKIFFLTLSLILVLNSCQKEDEVIVTENSLSQKELITKQFKELAISLNSDRIANIVVKDLKKQDLSKNCEDCEITLKLSSTTSGATAAVTITDSSGNTVFSGTVINGDEHTITINSCETYNITTQLLTGNRGNVFIYDGATKYSIPASGEQTTFQNYSFTCPVDDDVEECTITLCVNYLQGTTSGVHLGIFVNGSLSQVFFNLQDGECVTLTINENGTYEIKHIASNPSPNFSFSLQIDAQGYNLGYYMQGHFDTTGEIPSQYLQCVE